MKLNFYTFSVLYLICISFACGQKRTRNYSMVPLPVLYYSPETKLGLGAAATVVFRTNQNDSTSRRSNVAPYFIYTLNHQILSSLGYTLLLNQEKFRTEGEFAYYYFPEFYYGIGNNMPLSNQDTINYHWIRMYNKTQKKIANNLFAGFSLELVDMYDVASKYGNTLANTKPIGYQGSFIAGMGPSLTLDQRDNVLNASKGFYLDFSVLAYNQWIASQYNFSKMKIDFRYYTNVWVRHRHIWAFHFLGQFTDGNVPFKHLAQIGGDVIMRGYYAGRYRDNHLMAFQTEYRFPVWKFLGLVVFGGAGSVAANMGQFATNMVWTSYGGGIRIKVSKKDQVNIRLDYGVGNDGSSGYYVNIAEAF
jgi:outer membrane protein assembly factor BamA